MISCVVINLLVDKMKLNRRGNTRGVFSAPKLTTSRSPFPDGAGSRSFFSLMHQVVCKSSRVLQAASQLLEFDHRTQRVPTSISYMRKWGIGANNAEAIDHLAIKVWLGLSRNVAHNQSFSSRLVALSDVTASCLRS